MKLNMSKIAFKKKDIILIMLILILIVILSFLLKYIISDIIYKNTLNKCTESLLNFTDKNEQTIFTINKIVYFSSCDGKTELNNNSSFLISDLFQYTDIAIFLNNNSLSTPESTLKNVSIDNINFSLTPTVGSPSLYYKNINDFASSKDNTNNKIENSINFLTTSEDSIDYNTPILYNNCANPICLSYVNEHIKTNYTLSNTVSNVSYNGMLLKYCNVTLNSISCQISMTINITNCLDEHFSCPLLLQIPLSTESSTIYDGNLILKSTCNYRFIKNK